MQNHNQPVGSFGQLILAIEAVLKNYGINYAISKKSRRVKQKTRNHKFQILSTTNGTITQCEDITLTEDTRRNKNACVYIKWRISSSVPEYLFDVCIIVKGHRLKKIIRIKTNNPWDTTQLLKNILKENHLIYPWLASKLK